MAEAVPSLRTWAIPLVLLIGGLAVRMIDLTDEPLDRPSRQLRSAILTRGIYYRLTPDSDPVEAEAAIAMADSLEEFEPPIFEAIVAWTYTLIEREVFWVARIYSSLAWLAAGVLLYEVARRFTSPRGGWVSLAFFLFVPSSSLIGRVFQPDPLMILGIVACLYAHVRWRETGDRRWAWISGAVGGFSILIKAFALLPVLGVWTAGRVLAGRAGLRDRSAWIGLGLIVAIPGVYYGLKLNQVSSGYVEFWTVTFLPMLLQLRFYTGWLSVIRHLMDATVLLAGLAGTLLLRRPGRELTIGLWAGTVAYGLSVPWQTTTHDYYSLPFLPLVAVGLAPWGDHVLGEVAKAGGIWKWALGLLAAGAIGYSALLTRNAWIATDYRSEPADWRRIGEAIPRDGATLALTHEYGYRLMYYGWRQVSSWPSATDLGLAAARGGGATPAFDSTFADLTRGFRYFLVTLFGELEAQPSLRQRLCLGYELEASGGAFLLFDLHRPQTDGIDVCRPEGEGS